MRIAFAVGELVSVHPDYHSGIWLRDEISLMKPAETGHVPTDGLMTILEIISDNIKVVSQNGRIGWTWKNRLRKIQ